MLASQAERPNLAEVSASLRCKLVESLAGRPRGLDQVKDIGRHLAQAKAARGGDTLGRTLIARPLWKPPDECDWEGRRDWSILPLPMDAQANMRRCLGSWSWWGGGLGSKSFRMSCISSQHWQPCAEVWSLAVLGAGRVQNIMYARLHAHMCPPLVCASAQPSRNVSALFFQARRTEQALCERHPGSMDPDILAMAMANVGDEADSGGSGRRGASAAVLARARAKSAANRKERKQAAETRIDHEGAQVAALCIPGVASLLQAPGTSSLQPKQGRLHLPAMTKLAVSPKVKGSGAAIERVRRLQNVSCALLSAAALKLQRAGLERWLVAPPKAEVVHRVLGFSAMWDEASQKLKALLTTVRGMKMKEHVASNMSAPKEVQVMCVLGSVHHVQLRAGPSETPELVGQWQPWLAPPLFLTSTAHKYLIEGLARVLPVDLTDIAKVNRWTSGEKSRCVVVTLCFDFASSNVATFRSITAGLENADSPLLLHGERCATHCIHLVKARCIAASDFAGVLYSVSKLMVSNRVVDGLSANIIGLVSGSLEYRFGEPPSVSGLLDGVATIMGIDGNLGMAYGAGGGSAKRKPWYEAVQNMCEQSRFDPTTGKWVCYVQPGASIEHADFQQKAVVRIVQPLLEVFVARRWETAALSRWTGVMSCLKRMAVGVMMNSVFATALGKLEDKLGVTPDALKREQDTNAARAAAGEEVDDTPAKNMSRVLRASAFFRRADRAWQLGVTIVSVGIVDRLHWQVLGAHGAGSKATLTDLVDPKKTMVGEAMARVVSLLDSWSPDGEWAVLQWFRLPGWADADARRFTRNTLTRLAAGLFMRTEKRFCTWPYRLQWLLSASVDDETKDRAPLPCRGRGLARTLQRGDHSCFRACITLSDQECVVPDGL